MNYVDYNEVYNYKQYGRR